MMSYLPGEGQSRLSGYEMDAMKVQVILGGSPGKSHHNGKDRGRAKLKVGSPLSSFTQSGVPVSYAR